MRIRLGGSVLLCLLIALTGRAEKAGDEKAFDTKTASFGLTFHDLTSAYRDTSVLLMPGASVTFDAVGGPPGDYQASTEAGTLVQRGTRRWLWTAPARPGTYLLTIQGPAKHDIIAVHAFVLVPLTDMTGDLLNGYRIGRYPETPLKGNLLYLPPPGFVEVTRENQETRLSPHFTLAQFLCKQDTTKTFPKYVLVNERLPLKLEAILERVNAMGFSVDTLHVLSGFRTPYYNHAIGDVQYSLHQWGSAADIYIDPGQTNQMADVNRDGRIDIQDSKMLYDTVEQMLAATERSRLQGGMGFYPATSAHPPFVHVDVRGTAARWKG